MLYYRYKPIVMSIIIVINLINIVVVAMTH